jgi:protein-tyrosine phosphatase
MLRTYDPAALAAGDLDVQDPYYGPDDGFDRVLDQVEAAVDGLVEALRRELADDPRAP